MLSNDATAVNHGLTSALLIPRAADTPTVKRGTSGWRWYCLIIVSGISGLQGGYWANFGPITEAVEPLFGWGDEDIALLANWGPIMFLLAAAPTAWMLDVAGLRTSCIVASALVFVGSVLRCVHVQPDTMGSALMHAGQIVNAVAGPVAMAAGPVLSALWFPPSERTFATAVVGTCNYGGTAAMFVLGPMLVPSGDSSADTAENLRLYMIGEAAVGLALFIGALCFPRAPAVLPSISAGMPRVANGGGFARLRRVPAFWAFALSYGLTCGVFAGWGSMIGPNLAAVLPDDVAEEQAGWMGFGGAIAGVVGGVGLSAYADTRGKKKPLLVGLVVASVVSSLGFALLCAFPEPPSSPSSEAEPASGDEQASVSSGRLAALYATSIATALCVNAAVPLFYECAVEAAYPIAEGLVTTVLTVSMNVAALLFLLVPYVPNLGTQWMNWTLAASCLVAVHVVCPLAEPRRRLQIDVDEVHPAQE